MKMLTIISSLLFIQIAFGDETTTSSGNNFSDKVKRWSKSCLCNEDQIKNNTITTCFGTFPEGHYVGTALTIDASADTIWEKIKNPNSYASFTNSFTGCVKGDVAVAGEPIKLHAKLFPIIPSIPSKEKVTIVDDQNKVISWSRKLGSGYTERPQIVHSLPDGKSCYVTFLVLPKNVLGKTTHLTMAKSLLLSFKKFSFNLKNLVEKKN